VRLAAIALCVAAAVDLGWTILTIWGASADGFPQTVGFDLSIYIERTRSWLDGDGFYRARQLAGPYVIETGDALYPPPVILLFLPWALGAPAILWWAIPVVIGMVSLRRIRPPAWGWAALAGVLVFYPRTSVALILGNPSIWAFAAVLAGAAFGWPAVGALLKPALAPFALIGANRHSWWAGLSVLLLVATAFAAMWPEYLRVLADARNELGPQYLFGDIPIALVLALVGRQSSMRLARRPILAWQNLVPAFARVRSD
jgi:hypothetical protein